MDLYHHTTAENAKGILADGRFMDRGYPNRRVAWFSNVPHGCYGRDYGPVAVHVRIPDEYARDEGGFNHSAERFYTVPVKDITADNIVGTIERQPHAG